MSQQQQRQQQPHEASEDWQYDPERDNRGLWAEVPGRTTLDLFRRRSELRALAASHGRRPRVFVLSPSTNAKSGGIKVLHRLVHDLNSRGAPAWILHAAPNFPRQDWIDPRWNTPVLSREAWKDATLGDDSVVVVPEGSPEWSDDYLRELRGLGRAVKGRYVLNFSYLWPPGKPRDRNFSSDGTDFILVNNDYTGEFVAKKMGSNSVLVPGCVGRGLYHVDPAARGAEGRLVVSYVTRKSPAGDLVRRSLEGEFPGVEWVPMRDLPEADYARVLRRSDVYMTTGKLEGENLGVKEAWGSGALVVGYHGYGASLIMEGQGPDQNSVVVLPNGDDGAMVREMRRVLGALSLNRTSYRRVVEAAEKKLEEINADEDEQAEFVTDLLTAYRFGFPFESDHLWSAADNRNIRAPEGTAVPKGNRPGLLAGGLLLVAAVLLCLLSPAILARNQGATRRLPPGLRKQLLKKGD